MLEDAGFTSCNIQESCFEAPHGYIRLGIKCTLNSNFQITVKHWYYCHLQNQKNDFDVIVASG